MGEGRREEWAEGRLKGGEERGMGVVGGRGGVVVVGRWGVSG